MFAGAHRLLDAGVSGTSHGTVYYSRSAVNAALIITAIMRVLLFLAALGIITQGAVLDSGNPQHRIPDRGRGDRLPISLVL